MSRRWRWVVVGLGALLTLGVVWALLRPRRADEVEATLVPPSTSTRDVVPPTATVESMETPTSEPTSEPVSTSTLVPKEEAVVSVTPLLPSTGAEIDRARYE
jgi:cytoskeletal protein RodZ